jgi:hypothetical protein
VPLSYTGMGQNNFYSNDRNRPPFTYAVGWNDVVGGPTSTIPPPENVQAKGNFWGSAQGPEPSGAGDMASGPCDEYGGITNAKPFLITPHPMQTTLQ